ncbi:MAG: PilW family protein [Candidatus Eutrophobiaceae bacterium]
MISLTLGLLLLGGAISMFVSNKQIYREQEKMSRLQENMRFAIDYLLYDIRMAGHVGCMDAPGRVFSDLRWTVSDAARSQPWHTFTRENVLEGLEGSSTPKSWKPGGATDFASSGIVDRADGISVRYFEPTGMELIAGMIESNDSLQVRKIRRDPTTRGKMELSDSLDIVQGDAMAIADCKSAEIFTVSNSTTEVEAGTIKHEAGTDEGSNSTAFLRRIYSKGTPLYRVVSRRYRVGEDADGNSLFESIQYNPATMSATGTADYSPVALFQGMENIQFSYLVKGEDRFKHADDATLNWVSVSAVRIDMLLRTETPDVGFLEDTKNYSLMGGGSKGFILNAPSDRYRRRQFTTTVEIRNRR